MENFATYRLTQTGPETQAILDQVNENTTDIAQLRALYEALTQSEPVIIQPSDTWPVADPEENVIYRVIDRVNTPPESYSDYMWNGTAMVLMATYDNAIDSTPTAGSNNPVASGGVLDYVSTNGSAYDISAAHSGTAYEDLSAALGTDGANVPAAVRKGGMSVKFVQISDNNYVQYRYMSTSTANASIANVANWQGVDEEPENGSHNLVESGGVYSTTPTVTDYIGSVNMDLSISDEHGRVLAYFAKGHLFLKNFSSEELKETINSIFYNIGFYDVPIFSENENYSIGEIVRFGEHIYVFISEHTAGEWDESDVEITTIPQIEVKKSKIECDLSISDEDGNIIVIFKDGHIETKFFNSRINKKPRIKYLALGNSVNQDPACYIPYVLKKLYGDDIEFEIGIAYHGSYTIKDYVELLITGQERLETFSIAKNSATLVNHTGNDDRLTLLSNVIAETDWDIVSFEMYQTDLAGSGREEDITLSPDLLSWLKTHTKNGCRFGVVTPATYTDVRDLYVGWQQDILEMCALDFLLDYGATKEFLINSGFSTSDLSPIEGGKYIHSKEGFPCESLALTAIHCIADIIKIDDKASNLAGQITQAEHNLLNIPQQNGSFTSTSSENWRKCVDAALNGWRVSNASYIISNNSLRNETFTTN